MRLGRIAFVFCAALAATATTPVRGDGDGDGDAPPAFVRLEYRVVTSNESVGENVRRGTPLVPRTEGTIGVTLGPRRVEFVEGSRRTVLDPEHERVLRVEPDGSYRESSLLAYVAFIDMEMPNRARLAKVLGAAGMEDPSSKPREISILFGWRAKDDDTAVAAAGDGDAIVFRDGDEELARWKPSAEKLDDAQRASLSRFLQRCCHLHPAVREAIASDGRAPAALRFRWHDTGVRSTSELVLLAVKRTREVGSVPLTRRTFDDADPLARVARRVLDPTKEDAAARLTRDDFVRLAGEARKAGRYEDAALLLIECGLETGDAATDELRGLRSDQSARARLESFLGSVWNEDPARAIDAIARLDRTAFSRPHVLDVFRANDLAATGQVEDARTAMLDALAHSPWLTGAWKDLGDMYYRGFETNATWLAWEAGRRACPDHPMWSPIREYEERLRTEYGPLL